MIERKIIISNTNGIPAPNIASASAQSTSVVSSSIREKRAEREKESSAPLNKSKLGSSAAIKSSKPNLMTSGSTSNSNGNNMSARVSFQPSNEFILHSKHVGFTKLGGAHLQRKGSLYKENILPRSESIIQHPSDKFCNDIEISMASYLHCEKKRDSAPKCQLKTHHSLKEQTRKHIHNIHCVGTNCGLSVGSTGGSAADTLYRNRFSQIYSKYESDSEASAIELIKLDDNLRKLNRINSIKYSTKPKVRESSLSRTRNLSKSVDTGLCQSKSMKVGAVSSSNNTAKKLKTTGASSSHKSDHHYNHHHSVNSTSSSNKKKASSGSHKQQRSINKYQRQTIKLSKPQKPMTVCTD